MEQSIFKFEKTDVREITDENGNPWFVAKDVCAALGIKNPREAVSRLDDFEKSEMLIKDSLGRFQVTNVINEAGVFRLTYTSRKVAAKRMRLWFVTEVIPVLRGKTQFIIKNDDLKDDVGVAYMIKVGNAVKIGFTTDLNSRLSDIQVCNSKKVKLLAFSEGVTIEDEGFIHNELKNSHIRGEWFKITEEVIDFMHGFDCVGKL